MDNTQKWGEAQKKGATIYRHSLSAKLLFDTYFNHQAQELQTFA